mmetsp:Transcript_12537/g.38986  ORF Transcript_12537/g.38986 Transcript_12537/m.38986 type:complete len:324 (-) Transcript_12537:122-1093(-)
MRRPPAKASPTPHPFHRQPADGRGPSLTEGQVPVLVARDVDREVRVRDGLVDVLGRVVIGDLVARLHIPPLRALEVAQFPVDHADAAAVLHVVGQHLHHAQVVLERAIEELVGGRVPEVLGVERVRRPPALRVGRRAGGDLCHCRERVRGLGERRCLLTAAADGIQVLDRAEGLQQLEPVLLLRRLRGQQGVHAEARGVFGVLAHALARGVDALLQHLHAVDPVLAPRRVLDLLVHPRRLAEEGEQRRVVRLLVAQALRVVVRRLAEREGQQVVAERRVLLRGRFRLLGRRLVGGFGRLGGRRALPAIRCDGGDRLRRLLLGS